MALFLGVDGGQSATKAVVADETGRILGRGKAGPCNHAKAGEGRAKLERGLRGAIETALAASGRTLETIEFQASCLGMSGGPDDKRAIIAELIHAEHLEVTTDAHIALLGATGGGPGAVVIAGTGSIALARDRHGKTHRAGGWGYVFGDEGSAFDIVRRALRAALREEEGWGDATTLTQGLLDAVPAATDVNHLMHLFYTEDYPRSRVAALAPLVQLAAESGDATAADVLRDAGVALADYAAAAAKAAGLRDEPVCCVGGVFASPLVKGAFDERLSAAHGARSSAPRHQPDIGALIGAYLLDGVGPPEFVEEA